MRNRLSLLIALAVSALVAAAVATAHTTGGAHKAGVARSSEAAQRHYTAADQTLARSVVLKAADLGSASHWSGGVTAADTTQPRSCSNFHPRQSDLVITGDAQSDFTPTTGGLRVPQRSSDHAEREDGAARLAAERPRPRRAVLPADVLREEPGGRRAARLAGPARRASHRDVHRRLPGPGRPVRRPQHDRRALRRAQPHGDHPRDLGAVLGPGSRSSSPSGTSPSCSLLAHPLASSGQRNSLPRHPAPVVA